MVWSVWWIVKCACWLNYSDRLVQIGNVYRVSYQLNTTENIALNHSGLVFVILCNIPVLICQFKNDLKPEKDKNHISCSKSGEIIFFSGFEGGFVRPCLVFKEKKSRYCDHQGICNVFYLKKLECFQHNSYTVRNKLLRDNTLITMFI